LNSDKIDFHLPENHQGPCLIMYECNDGISPPKENGRKQIHIPTSGVIKLKDQIPYGKINYRYFMSQSSKGEIELKLYQSFEKPTDNFYVGPGTVVTEYSFDSSLKNNIKQSAFLFFVHKARDAVSSHYDESWITDTLRKQIQINKR